MTIELREIGISAVGDIPWGTHFCHFYETKQDLLDTVIPYFKAGLESKEFCLWVVSNSGLITVEEAKEALGQAVPDFDRHFSDGNIEILNGTEWYLEESVFKLERVTSAWDAKLERALARGYDGMRVSGDTFWLGENGWKDFCVYEKQLNDSITDRRMTLLCTYPLAKSGAAEILDVVQTHQFAIVRRQGNWEIVETPELKQTKAEIKRLNEELERRVAERTIELVTANEKLRREVAERERADEQLKQSESQLAEAQRLAHVGSWSLDLSSNTVTWSDELYRIFGVQPSEFDHRYEAVVGTTHPEDRDWLRSVIEDSRETHEPFSVYYRITLPTGELRVLHAHGAVVTDEHGNASRMHGTAQDVTERKQAEEALKESQRRLEVAQRIAHVGHYEHNLDTGVIVMSDENYRILGIQPQDSIMLARAFEFMHPEDRERVHQVRNEAVRTGQHFDVEYRFVRPDGDVRYIHSHGDVIRDEQGRARRTFGIAQDITERKRAEDELKKEKEILEKIFDNIPVMIGFIGEDGRVKLVNPEWERTMGWTLQELQEQNVDIFAEAYPDLSYRQEVLDFVAASTGEWVDLKIKVRDGRVIDAACAVVHLSDGTRVAIAQDITERKQAEEMLQTFSQRLIEAQESERRRVARELHDEIGQALTVIKINLQAVQHSAGASPLAQQLNESTGIVDRALQQVRDLSFNLRPSLLDDLGLIAALRWYVDREARRAGLLPEFVADLSETRLPPELETACFRITQEALTNVVRHAQARRIWVELRRRGTELHLTVRDDGIGFNVDAVWKRRVSDKGLGLQGMQERALILNGKIEITSAPPQGTEIHVWFSLTVIPSSANEEGDSAL